MRSICECWHCCIFEIICELLSPLWEIAQSTSLCLRVALLLFVTIFFCSSGSFEEGAGITHAPVGVYNVAVPLF